MERKDWSRREDKVGDTRPHTETKGGSKRRWSTCRETCLLCELFSSRYRRFGTPTPRTQVVSDPRCHLHPTRPFVVEEKCLWNTDPDSETVTGSPGPREEGKWRGWRDRGRGRNVSRRTTRVRLVTNTPTPRPSYRRDTTSLR